MYQYSSMFVNFYVMECYLLMFTCLKIIIYLDINLFEIIVLVNDNK